jgi:hypothetical protein
VQKRATAEIDATNLTAAHDARLRPNARRSKALLHVKRRPTAQEGLEYP